MASNWLDKLCKKICDKILGPDASGNSGTDPRPWRNQSEYIAEITEGEAFGLHRTVLLSLARLRRIDLTHGLLYRKRSTHSRDLKRYNEKIVGYRLLFFLLFWASSHFKLYWTKSILGAFSYWFLVLTTGYASVMLVGHLLGVVFLREYYNKPYSNDRSLIFVLIHYIEITIAFAIMHKAFTDFGCCKSPNVFDILYFSFVTSATLGYGDLTPDNFAGELLVILQIFVMLLFVVVFLNHFSTTRSNKLSEGKEG